MDDRDTLTVLAEELALALQPLEAAFDSAGAFRDFLEDLGWDFNAAPSALDTLRAPVQEAFELISNPDGIDAADVARLISSVRSAFAAISALSSAAGLAADFKNEFPRQLLDYLTVDYLLNNQPRVGYLLLALGVISLEERPAAGARPPYLRRDFAWERLSPLFQNPLSFFKNVYHWGEGDFAGDRFISGVGGALEAWGLYLRGGLLDEQTVANLNKNALQPDQTTDSALRLVLIENSMDAAQLSAGIGLFLLPETASDKPGFAVLPFATAGFEEKIEISDQVSLSFRGKLDLTGGAGILVRPNRDVDFLLGLASGTPAPASGNLEIVLSLTSSGTPFTLIGDPEASRFQLAGASTTAGTRLSSAGKLDVFAEFALEQGKIVIKPSSDTLDGFLARLLPANGMELDASLTVGVSTEQGIYFSGSGGLEISLPTHIDLGPIEIQSALVAVKPADGTIPVELAATFKADLGVLEGVIENVGIKIVFTFPPNHDGNLGPVQLDLAFRPPNGVGLALDAGIVRGGGYLFFDFDREEYAGVLELAIADIVTVKAIGLITTKMPDGSKAFSLLIIITAEFGTGIQLGFGFTLLGLGGLLCLNRTMLFQPIMDGVKSGAIQSVMFPQDIIGNAPRIISDLQTFFPPQDGTFLIGPMAKIGWGTPTLISLSLGVIIEIPPGDAAILGILRVALPADELAILVLRVNFAGALEFDKQRFYFFASLFDSHVLFITLTGQMGVLFLYGDDANFVLSVGGFHPQFNPPPLPFPAPQRIAIDLINESFAKIHSDGYFAVSTNTVQFGAHSNFFFGFSACSVEGSSGFDALIQFSPFHFIAEVSAQFAIKVFGIGVYGVGIDVSLSGPTPWHVHGTASLSFFFFSIDIGIDFTWGADPNTTLPPIAVMPILTAEFAKNTNWKAQLPSNSNLLVTLRQLDASEATMVLHPAGFLQVSQRSVPLDLQIDKVGNQPPSDANQFVLSVVGTTLVKTRNMQEPFAPSQFRNFDDATKLSQAAYVPQDSGIELAGGSNLNSATAITRPVRYDLTVIDAESEPVRNKFFPHIKGMFTTFLRANSAAQSPLSAAFRAKAVPYTDSVKVSTETFAVAFQSSNQAVHPEATSFTSQASAQDYMAKAVATDPSLSGKLHVLPKFEVAA